MYRSRLYTQDKSMLTGVAGRFAIRYPWDVISIWSFGTPTFSRSFWITLIMSHWPGDDGRLLLFSSAVEWILQYTTNFSCACAHIYTTDYKIRSISPSGCMTQKLLRWRVSVRKWPSPWTTEMNRRYDFALLVGINTLRCAANGTLSHTRISSANLERTQIVSIHGILEPDVPDVPA